MKLYHGWMLVCLFAAYFLCIGSQEVQASHGGGGDFGVGFEFGEPIGATAKYWLDHHVAFDLGMGYSWDHYWVASFDLLFHGHYREIHPYIGMGAEMMFNHYENWWGDTYWRTAFAARMPIGFEFRKDIFGFFMEIDPGIVFTRDIEAMIQGGVGLRFYFE